MRKWSHQDGAIVGGDFFIGAGRKEDRAINATDNTPGSTRAGMIGAAASVQLPGISAICALAFHRHCQVKVSKDRNYGDNAVVTFQLSQPCAACHTYLQFQTYQDPDAIYP